MLILATIVYIIDPDTQKVLMAKKRRKIGVGKWFGYGGKFEPQDNGDARLCTVREVEKETNGVIILDPALLEPVALIDFYNSEEKRPYESDPIRVLCYRTFQKVLTPETSDEMEDPTWFPLASLPWECMKKGDEYFVPQILTGTPVKGYVWFTKDEQKIMGAMVRPCSLEELYIAA